MLASPRTTLARHVASAVVLLAGAVVGVACSANDEDGTPDPAGEPASPTTTPLASYDTEGLVVARRDPCAAVPAEVVAEVLGGEPTRELAWAPGQRVPGTPDIGDEWGCSRTAGDVTASAWVFAVPVSRGAAQGLVDEVTGPKCRRSGDADTFGRPGVAFTCTLNAGSPLSGRRGLVGTTWVTCEIRGAVGEERVDRWCAAVLDSLSS